MKRGKERVTKDSTNICTYTNKYISTYNSKYMGKERMIERKGQKKGENVGGYSKRKGIRISITYNSKPPN